MHTIIGSMRWILIYLMILSSISSNKIKLNIEINGIKKPGKLFLAVYDNPLVFESKNPEINTAIVTEVIEETRIGVFRKSIRLSEGVYAISFYIDRNNNGRLDFNFFGIPTEEYGFSNDVIGLFGPPSFKDASFKISKDKSISIKAR